MNLVHWKHNERSLTENMTRDKPAPRHCDSNTTDTIGRPDKYNACWRALRKDTWTSSVTQRLRLWLGMQRHQTKWVHDVSQNLVIIAISSIRRTKKYALGVDALAKKNHNSLAVETTGRSRIHVHTIGYC
jgi:hypothetical protein